MKKKLNLKSIQKMKQDKVPLSWITAYDLPFASAAKQYGGEYWHHVQYGESMYSIAQKYGISLKKLYKMNFKSTDYTPIAGDLLKVR